MPILDVQRRVAVIGHIRLGEQTTSASGKRVPRALRSFRFTSPRQSLLVEVARVYGGTVAPWSNPSTGLGEYEVYTEANEVPVLVPPSDVAFAQHYELWAEGGCQRRCDGFTEVHGNEPQPCVCNAEGERACSSVTRLSLLLPEVAHVFGVWRLVTTSYYASGELLSAVDLALGMAARRAEHLAAAYLRLEQRVAKRPGQPPNRYTVPVLDVILGAEALGALVSHEPEPAAIAAPEREHEALGPTRGAAALTVVGLPEPAPRIDRGAPSPPPAMLADEGTAPSYSPSNESATPLDDGLGEQHPSGAPERDEAKTSGAPSGLTVAQQRADERKAAMRYVFGKIAELWPNKNEAERDRARAAVAYMVTAKTRDTPETSWANLTDDELQRVTRCVLDLINGALVLRNLVGGGYVFTLKGSGRKLYLEQDASGQWSHWVDEKGVGDEQA